MEEQYGEEIICSRIMQEAADYDKYYEYYLEEELEKYND